MHGHGPPAAPQRAVRRYGLAAIAAVVVAITGWLLFGQHAATPNREGPGTANAPAATGTATPRAAARPAVPQRTVLETLSLARIAFRDQSRLLPRFDAGRDGQRGDSALELYAEVLAQDARNDEARDGVARLSNAVQTRLQADLAAGRMDEAALLIAAYKAAGADPAQILKFEADIRAAQPKWLASQAQQAISTGDLATADQALTQAAASGADRKLVQDLRHALESRQQELQLQQLAGEVHAAIAAGNLLDPAVGNARTKLLAMRQLNRNHAATLAAQRELQSVLLERAREQQQSGQFDAALLWNSAAAELASTDETTEQRRRIRADQELQAAHSAAVVAAAAAAPAAPAAPSAPAVAKPSYLKATPSRPLDAHYPQILTGSKITGTVVVEFTLQADGSASDATIVEATAPGVFDRAATAAVARGRFDVSVLGASRQPQRARIKLNFQP